MGDTVAHAARAPDDQEQSGSSTDRSHKDRDKDRGKDRGKNRDKDRRHKARGKDCGGNQTPDSDTDIDNPTNQNGDVLSGGNSPDAAGELSQIKMEGDEAKREGGGGDNNDTLTADVATLTPGNSTQLVPEIDKSDEDLSLSLRDGSSENISSIEIDTSLGNDLSFGASTNAGDDTSPETETGLEIGAGLSAMNNSDSLNDIPTTPGSPRLDEDMTEADNQASERSSSESGFVEGSTSSSDHKTQSAAAPPDSHVSDTGTKGRKQGGSVPCGDKSVPSTSSDSGILPAASKSKMEEELQFLREEVRHKSASVQRLQTSLYEQQVRANVAMVALRTQLRNKDRDMQHVRGQHDQRMSALLSHLLYLEGQMRQEQRQVLELLHEKDDVIRRQKSAIEDLASKNARLLTALKEVHGYSGGNGISTPGTPAEAGEKGAKVTPATTTPVVLRNKEKAQKVRFGSVKDKLRRHKSSLELHRPASLDTLVEGTLRYGGSQENLSRGSQQAVSPSSRRKGSEGLCSDELKKTRQQERKERCKSLIDYPFRLNDLPEVSSEVEKGKEDSPLPDASLDLSLSHSPRNSQSCQQLSTPQNRNSLYSDEDEAFHSHDLKQYGELSKSTSMPQSLASPSDQEVSPTSVKERPHSLSGVELSLNMEKMSMMPMVSMNPSPTSQEAPGGSDSNPFKSFKNVFRRRNSKQRNKKRPASLGQQTNQEYHEALKEHFKKYDLN